VSNSLIAYLMDLFWLRPEDSEDPAKVADALRRKNEAEAQSASRA